MPTNPEPANRAKARARDVDGVELKVTVSEEKERAAADAFELEPNQGERRRIFFFDTAELALFRQGLVLRAREVRAGRDDSTVKIRPVDPDRVSATWRSMDGFKIEADGVGNRMILSASLSAEQRDGEIEAVEQKRRPIEKLFSREQESLLAELSPVPVDFTALGVLGPVDALRWRVEHDGLPYAITVEEWTLPDGQDLVEVSIKVPTARAVAASTAFASFLQRLRLEPRGGRETKTRVALDCFVKQRAKR